MCGGRGGGLALHGIIVHSHQLRTGLFGNTANIVNIGNTANICNIGNTANIVNIGNTANIGNTGNTANIANIGNTANIGTHTNCPLAYLEAKSYDCISSAVDLKSPCFCSLRFDRLLLQGEHFLKVQLAKISNG